MKKLEKAFPWLLGLAAIIAGAVSLLIGLQQSVWFDEAYSISVAEHSWTEIVELTAQDVHPPGYYWLLKAWMTMFGSGEFALRNMSALFLSLSVVGVGALLRKFFGARAAITVLPFIVFAPFLLRYGFEIRMYSFASFIGVGATYILVNALEQSREKMRWLLFSVYALLVAVGVYTLYFMALIWIAHLVWLAWLVYAQRKHELIAPGLISYLASFLLFLPWLPVFLRSANGDTLSTVTSELGFQNLYGIASYLFLYQPPWEHNAINVLATVFVLVAIIYLALQGYKKTSTNERRYVMLLACYFFVPLLVLIVVTHIKPIYIERYIAHIAVGVYAGIGALVALSLRSGQAIAKIFGGGLLILLLVGSMNLARLGNYNFQRLHEPSVKQVAGLLTECREGAIIFADGPQIAVELNYYIADCPVYFFNETLEMSGGFAMLSHSPLRVADASELPDAEKVLHVFYDKPKRTVPSYFYIEKETKIEALGVIEYRVSGSDVVD